MKERITKEVNYGYCWDLITQVYLCRYPTNPYFPMLLDHEISFVQWIVDKGLFYCEKRSTMFIPVPKMLRKISKVDHCYVYQNLVIDIPTQIMKESSWNRIDAKTYHMKEDAVWIGDGENQTRFTEESNINISPKIPKPIARPVLKKVVKEFNQGYDLARQVDNALIEDFKDSVSPTIVSIQDFCERQKEHQKLSVAFDFTCSFEYSFELSGHTGRYI